MKFRLNQIQIALVVALLVVVAAAAGCGSQRHLAVQVDAAFSTAVFAASDAAMAACTNGTFTQTQCVVGGSVNRNAQQALVDVKAVTQALQDAPKSVVVPKNLPDLLKSLTNLQTLVGDLAPALPGKATLASKLTEAIAKAIALIQSFTTGD
jgi:hypothetical protein